MRRSHGAAFGRVRVLIAVAPLMLLVGGCSTVGIDMCGWDTSTTEGAAALNEHLASVNGWLTEHPGEPAPAITSPYWHGECPTDPMNVGPPDDEDENPH